MIQIEPASSEIFSFHLMNLPLIQVPPFLLAKKHKQNFIGLNHSESFFTMGLGQPITSMPRYKIKSVAFFAWWKDSSCLDDFLNHPSNQFFQRGWHVRMKLYRRWGEISELQNAVIHPSPLADDQPMVAVTLARLNLLQTSRFIRYGRPVENQVRDHQGQCLALAAMRPLNTFSTLSVWKNEAEMINMVYGKDKIKDGESHKLAMQERIRKDFHHEFATMRFMPFEEHGLWNGKSGYTSRNKE